MRQTYVESSQDHSLRQKRLVQEGLDGPIQGKKPHLPFLTQSLTLILQEGRTGQVTITNFKPAEIDCLLKFIYTGTINLRKSYPRDNTWRALIKIWKMADFFCLDILCELVIAAAKDCSMQMARVFCAFNVPNGHDQYKISLFDTDFAPAVKAIYEDEEEIAKPHFAPIILGQAVVSIHKLSQMEEFEKLLRDVPSFAVDWATAFMKGLPQPTWSTMGLDDRCTYCERSLDVDGIVDTIQFMRGHDEVLCPQCYRLASLEVWKNHLRW